MTRSLREELEEYMRTHAPVKMPKSCITCGRKIPYGSRCKQHGGSNWDRYGAEHPERREAYKDPAWKTRREAWLAEHPWCARCGLRATDVDHVLPVAITGRFDGPVQSLCRRCHLAKTAADSKASKRRRQQ